MKQSASEGNPECFLFIITFYLATNILLLIVILYSLLHAVVTLSVKFSLSYVCSEIETQFFF